MFRRRRKKQPTTLAPVAPDLPEVRDIASVALVQQIARGDLRLGPLPTGPDREAIVREEVLCAMAAGSDITDDAVAALSPDVGSNGVKPDRRLAELHQRLLDDLRHIANVTS